MASTAATTTKGVRDGRYVGGSGRYWLELRVDLQGSDCLSGELQATGPSSATGDGPCSFYASFRMLEGPVEKGVLEWTDSSGSAAKGTLHLEPVDDEPGTLAVQLELGGLSPDEPGSTVSLRAHWTSSALRELGLEIEVEEGVLQDQNAAGRHLERIGSCLERSGLAVHELAQTSLIPAMPDGWATSDIFGALHDVMRNAAQASLAEPAWEVHLLMLSRTKRDGLLGLMFDPGGGLPRQGAAVFVDTIRANRSKDRAEDKVVQTAVHEIGHALNLRHRFDRGIRRSTSTSFMNYDWRYRGGDVDGFWSEFDFTFDADELKHLNHAPRGQVIPGGSPFGSARYWDPDYSGDSSAPGAPYGDLRLWLTPPAAGPSFAYGQPVFLEVSLLNSGQDAVSLPRHALDVKAGQLDLLVRRVGSGTTSRADQVSEATPYVPIMRRCFDLGTAGSVRMGPGDSMHSNVNLAYGAEGSDLAEPGTYEVVPALTFPPPHDSERDAVVFGTALRFRVAPPLNRAEEADGETLRRPDVRANLALGGSAALRAAADDLEDLRERRASRTPEGRPDPVVSVLTRCAGIQVGRHGSRRQAARLLADATEPAALAAFDPHTAEHTRRLAARYAAADDPFDRATGTPVVIDLSISTHGSRSGVRRAGFLVGTPMSADDPAAGTETGPWTSTGLAVLAPVAGLADRAMDPAAALEGEVTVSARDGLTQRLKVSRVDLAASEQDGGPELALLRLANPVPASGTELDIDEASRTDLAGFFGRTGPAASIAAMDSEALDPWASAADEALAEAPGPTAPPATNPAVFAYPGLDLDDVAGWRCWFTPACDGPPPRVIDDGAYPFRPVGKAPAAD